MNLHETHQKRAGEDIFGLIFLAVSVMLLWQSWAIAGFSALSSPGAFPMAASAVMVLASLVVVIGNARKGRKTSGEPILPRTVAIFTGLVILYALALDTLGFLPSSFLFLVAGMKLLYRGGWARTLVLSVVSLALVYIIFRLVFQVVLPEGVVPEGDLIAGVRRLLGGGAD